MSDGEGPYAERIIATLSPALGPHTATRALHLAAQKLGREPASLDASHAPELRARLEPMLKTLVGRAVARELLDALADTEA